MTRGISTNSTNTNTNNIVEECYNKHHVQTLVNPIEVNRLIFCSYSVSCEEGAKKKQSKSTKSFKFKQKSVKLDYILRDTAVLVHVVSQFCCLSVKGDVCRYFR